MLYKNEVVYDDSNIHELLGHPYAAKLYDGSVVNFIEQGGQRRYLSGTPKPLGHDSRLYSSTFKSAVQVIPRSEWSARIAEQWAQKRATSQIQTWQSDDQGSHPTCFPAGTMIRMADGSQRRIEDVKTTDLVLTAEGNTRMVAATMVKQSDGLVNVAVWGHSHLQCTPEHPFLTKRGYIAAKDLTPEDYLCFPRYLPSEKQWISTEEYVQNRHRVKQTHRTRYVGLPGKAKVAITTHILPDIVYLTRAFGRLVGFFLAEGSTGKGTAQWTFNVTEKDTFASEVVDCLRGCLGVDARIRLRPNNTAQVEVHGVAFAKLFESLCSVGSGNKRLHPDLCGGPREFLEGVLTSWMDGDRQVGNAAVSVSRELALNMFDIANALGKMPILSTHTKAHIGKDGIFRRHAWKVGWGEGLKMDRGSHQSDAHMWRRVRHVLPVEFSGNVFNLSVEGDNSYVAEGVGVHNCWAAGTCAAFATARVRQGHPHVYISAMSVACPISGGSSGGYEGDAVSLLTRRGGVSTDLWGYTEISRAKDNDPACEANRLLHKSLESFECNSFDEFATAWLLGFPTCVSYSWWSHVVMGCDLVEVESGSFGVRIRNNWGESYGSKNDNGVGGYNVFREGHGTPSDGFAFRQVTASTK